MKKAFILPIALILFFLIVPVYAQEYEIGTHEVRIQVDSNGNASATERFYLNFPNETERASFRTTSTQLGSDMDKWLQFNSKFQPNIKNPNAKDGGISNKKIYYNEGQDTYLEISYNLDDPLMAKLNETPTGSEFALKAIFLNNFFEFGLWVIPDNTKIIIELPLEAEVREPVEPAAVVSQIGSKKVVQWEGYKSGNNLELRYVLWKQIAIDFNLFTTLNNLIFTETGISIIIIVAIIIGAIFYSRKKISQKVEDFVADNSKLEDD
ncbi:MAG: hypothetical protein WC308_00280 [archaeon]